MRNRKVSRSLSILLAALLILLSCAGTFAAAKVKITITDRPLSDKYRKEQTETSGVYSAGNVGMLKVNGETAFCIQAGWGIDGMTPSGGTVTHEYIKKIEATDSLQSRIAYLGWYKSDKKDSDYAYTQMYIWKTLPDYPRSGNDNVRFTNSNTTAEYNRWKEEIDKKLDKWYTAPSFSYSQSGKSIKIKAGETINITDKEQVLEDYGTFSYAKDGITVKHTSGSNTLNVAASKTCRNSKVVMTPSVLADAGAQKYRSEVKTNFTYTKTDDQDMSVYGAISPVPLSLSFEVDTVTGKIAVEKVKAPDSYSEQELPEEGAEFQIYLKSAGSYTASPDDCRDVITTGKDGKAVTKELPHGTYIVHQTKGAIGHKLTKDFEAVIGTGSHDKVYTYRINNETLQAKLKIVKKDAETGKVIPLAGTKFELTSLTTDEQIKSGSEDGYFETDENGRIELDFPLYYGSYRLTERKAPEGYKVAEPVEFAVDGSEEAVTVEVKDEPQKGRIKIHKTGEILQTVRKNEDGTYTPVFGYGNLEGAEFEIRAAEDIVTPDGTVRMKKGESAGILVTDKDGTAESEEQYLGKYNIKETKAPCGYVTDHRVHTVELKYAGQEAETAYVIKELSNQRQKVRINFEKHMEEDKVFGINSEDMYEDISFGLFAGEEIRASDGSVIPKGGMLQAAGVLKHKEKGKRYGKYYGRFEGKLPVAKYYVKEIMNNESYIPSSREYMADFISSDQAEEVETININEGRPIENYLKRGSVSGIKTGSGGEKLEGVLIGLFAAEEKKLTEKGAVMTARTDKDGRFSFQEVPCGNWVIGEVETLPGYVLLKEPVPVSITEDDSEIEVLLSNEKTGVKISKIDSSTGENISGAVLQLIDHEGNIAYQWTSGENPRYIEGLPKGRYALHEVKPPEGYLLSGDILINVEDTEEIQEFQFFNDLIPKTGDNNKRLFKSMTVLLTLAAFGAALLMMYRKHVKSGEIKDGRQI